jgi:DNA-binding MarR family transcriptional regulator
MQSDAQFPKIPCKAEFLCRMIERHPSIDVSIVQIVSYIQSISKNLTLTHNHELIKVGLTEGKFYVLAFLFSEELAGHEEPSPSQIADHITGLLDGLERDGFLERCHDARDRRGLTIRITDKARSILDRLLPDMSDELTKIIDLTPDEKRNLIQALGKLETALDRITPSSADLITQ